MAKRFFEVFWQEEEVYVASWARRDAQWKGPVELEISQGTSRELQMLNNRQEIFKNAIEGKLRVQSRASEILQGQITGKIKEMEHTKKEEALQLVRKEHDLWMYQNEKEEAKKLQGARKPRKEEEVEGVPRRNISKWSDWEEARWMEEIEWRLELEGGSGSARNHYRVGCGGRHFCGPGWRKPP